MKNHLQILGNIITKFHPNSEITFLIIAIIIIIIIIITGEEGEEKSDSGEEIVDTFRVIGLRRKAGESLVTLPSSSS